MQKLIEAGGMSAADEAVHRRHARPEHAAHRRQRPPAQAAPQDPLVVIDYLQLIDPDNRRDSRQEQVAADLAGVSSSWPAS